MDNLQQKESNCYYEAEPRESQGTYMRDNYQYKRTDNFHRTPPMQRMYRDSYNSMENRGPIRDLYRDSYNGHTGNFSENYSNRCRQFEPQTQRRTANNERRNRVKPPIFNGSYNEWPLFKSLFLEAAEMNAWSNQESRYYLMANVNDEARTFLLSLNNQMKNMHFHDLLEAMEKRFGVTDQSPHFQSLLESMTWKTGDNLRKYLDEVRRLVALAYTEVPSFQQEALVKKHFINGLMEPQLKQKMLIEPPPTSESAMQYAERYVAAKQAMGTNRSTYKERVRMIRNTEETSETEDEGSSDEENLELEIVNLLKSKGFISKKKPFKKFDKSKIKCYACRGYGHMAKDCANTRMLNELGSRPTGEGEVKDQQKSL